MSRFLLIGQAPGPNTNPDAPLWPEPASSTGGRLAGFAGMGARAYLRTFDRINLLNEFPGRTQKRDDTWPVRDARIAASAIRPLLLGRSVILVGRNVSDAFSLGEIPFHTWTRLTAGRRFLFDVAVIPHPSGRNHWYRKPENMEQVRAFWSAIREYPREGGIFTRSDADQ